MKLKMFYLVLLLLISINTGCKNSSNPDDYNLPLPALKDSIPYGSLGQGKIVFERIGPLSNNYDGGYVIDINNHKSWGVHNGVFDGPSISPDGKLVAFAQYTPPPANSLWDIYSVNIDGSNLQQITSIIAQEHCPSWSKNGDYIYDRATEQLEQLYKTALSSHISTLVFSTMNMESPASVALDGRILFSDYNNIIVWQNNSLSTIKSDSIQSINLYSPCYNPQGDKIAYIEATTDTLTFNYKIIKVIKMDSDGNNSITLVELNMDANYNWEGSNNTSLCWSPDGTKIAFNKPESYLCAHIYVINSDGTNLVQVTSAEGVTDRSVSWGN